MATKKAAKKAPAKKAAKKAAMKRCGTIYYEGTGSKKGKAIRPADKPTLRYKP
jgi:hypothetical protein